MGKGKKDKYTIEDLWKATEEYYKKFNESPPAIGFGFKPSTDDYVDLLKKCVKEGKKLKVDLDVSGMVEY